MAIFDGEGQVASSPLTDEALAAMAEGQDAETAAPEDQNDTEVIEEESVEEQTEEAKPVESPEQPTQDSPAEPQTSKSPEATELERIKKQYSDLRAWSTKLAMENSQLKKGIQSENKPVEAPKKADPKEFIKSLVNDGEEGFNRRVEEKARELIQPILDERAKAEQNRVFSTSFNEAAESWSQLKTEDGRKEMLTEMVKIAMADGNPEAWKGNPDLYIFKACKSLWSYPKVVDTAAIEAARKTERESVIKEYEEKQKKGGLVVQQQANKDRSSDTLSPEEKIIEEMRKASRGGLFG